MTIESEAKNKDSCSIWTQEMYNEYLAYLNIYEYYLREVTAMVLCRWRHSSQYSRSQSL